jgi:lipopolysaccharide export system protein LptA
VTIRLFTIALLMLAAAAAGPLTAVWAAEQRPGAKSATRIQSEQLQHDDQRQVTVFSGNVSLVRDGLTLHGYRLELSQRADGSSTAILLGRPARFTQLPRAGSGEVVGRSNRMEFDSRTEVIVLQDNAQLRRTEGERLLDEVVGDRITYNSAAQTYAVQTEPGQGRAQMTLLPRVSKPAGPAAPEQ